MLRRFRVVGAGLALGAVIALEIVGPMMPSGLSVRDRALVWAVVMTGPVLDTVSAGTPFRMPAILGWLGLLLVPAHPNRPHWATGLLTTVGLALWFFAGFITVMVAAWGA